MTSSTYNARMTRIDLRPLLNCCASGNSIEICGVRPGDPAARLCDAPLTGGEDRRSQRRSYRSGKIFRVLDAGYEQEIPLPEMVALVLKNGGVLHVGMIAFSIDRGK